MAVVKFLYSLYLIIWLSSAGSIEVSIPVSALSPATLANLFNSLNVPTLMTTFQEFKPQLFGKQPVQVSAFSLSTLQLNTQAMSYEIQPQTTGILYTADKNSIHANFTFNWKSDKGQRGQATGNITFAVMNFTLQFKQSEAKRLIQQIKLAELGVNEMTINSGIQVDYVKQRAQALINSQVVGNYTIKLSQYLSNEYFPKISQELFSELGNDQSIEWKHSRLPLYAQTVNFTLLTPPSIQNQVFRFDFSGDLPKPQNSQVSVSNLKLRSLQEEKQSDTCIQFSNQILESSFSNARNFYSKLFYFNKTLNAQFPQTKSFSPFYNYEVLELMMWGSGIWSYIKNSLNIQSQNDTFQILSSQLQINCQDNSKAVISIEQVKGKTSSSSIRMGAANLNSECNIEVSRAGEWFKLFEIEYEVKFDILLKYESTNDPKYCDSLVGGITNLNLVSFSTPNQGLNVYMDQLRLRINTIIENLPIQEIELIGQGLQSIQFEVGSVTLEINESGLLTCGEAHLPLN